MKTKQMKETEAQPLCAGRHSALRITSLLALVLIGTVTSGRAQSNVYLPVYQIIQSGATASQARTLADSLNMPFSRVGLSNGLVSFIDPTNYLPLPTITVSNNAAASNLVHQTANQYPQIPIRVQAIDFTALDKLTVLSGGAALNSASNALNASGLSPQFGTPVAQNSTFIAFYTNSSGVVISNTHPLDTEVDYRFTDPNGHPMMGPGAQVQLSYGPAGNVTRLLYAARQLSNQGITVQVISSSTAIARAALLFPPGAQIGVELVYWHPPFWPPPSPCYECPPPVWNPQIIIPWYYCTATMNETNPASGIVTTTALLPQFIPATDDARFVPALQLNVPVPPGGTDIVANAGVTGGTPPYSYSWSGSDPSVSSNTDSSISYTPTIRISYPPLSIIRSNNTVTITWPDTSTYSFILESSMSLTDGWSQVSSPVQTSPDVDSVTVSKSPQARFFRLALASNTIPVTEVVSVEVTDANGVSASATQTVSAQAVPVQSSSDPAIDYGCESPYDPGLGTGDRVSWQAGMNPAFGSGPQRFCWLNLSAWPGDFIEPPVPGVLPARPWIFGDADFLNWGVNSADIVLYIGHGNPNIFTFIINSTGGNIGSCGFVNPLSGLWEPLYQQNFGQAVEMPNLGVCAFGPPIYNVPNYIDSWRNGGPTVNDNLWWLCLLSCEVLQEYDGSTPPVAAWTRWGPGFNRLHILTGFDSLALAGTGFPARFANNFLVGPGPGAGPLTIVQAWRSAAKSQGTGTPAALGPIDGNGFCDFNDFYWGKGPVGPSIPAALIRGWWYIKN
jgi:Family of unknown function (DUF6345)